MAARPSWAELDENRDDVSLAGNLDWLTNPEGVDFFEGLFSKAVENDAIGRKIKVASIDDLYLMKMAAGRPKD